MSEAGLKLTVYFGEGDRSDGRFLSEEVLDVFGAHGLSAGLLARGVEGFGVKHARRTDRLLSLSEDLPLVAVGVDERRRVEAALEDVMALPLEGLVTLERARLIGDGAAAEELAGLGGEVRLTVYAGRGARARGAPAHEQAVRLLREAGVDGATVLVGVDGTLGGRRRRARFFSRNSETPLTIVSVGGREAIGRALDGLRTLPGAQLLTAERVRVLKRDGEILAGFPEVSAGGSLGLDPQVKLTLFSAEQNHFGGRPVHIEAIRRLRSEGARGATALRGVWGYHGDHAPHGDTFASLRRRVPTMTVTVDEPEACRRWFEILDELTPRRGLITSEIVPAHQARGEGGGLSAGRELRRGGPLA